MVALYLEQLEHSGLPAEVVLPVWRGREHQQCRRPNIDKPYSVATIKVHLSAIRNLFGKMVTGNPAVLAVNPAAAVKPPKLIREMGVTPAWDDEDLQKILGTLASDERGYSAARDRALIMAMVCSFARVSAILAMTVDDYRQGKKGRVLHLIEKGRKERVIPVHFKAQQAIDRYFELAGIANQPETPLWRAMDKRSRF